MTVRWRVVTKFIIAVDDRNQRMNRIFYRDSPKLSDNLQRGVKSSGSSPSKYGHNVKSQNSYVHKDARLAQGRDRGPLHTP